MQNIYQIITDRIIAELEYGVIPWQCSWRPPEWTHRNMISQRPYRGINRILLSLTKYGSPFWLTPRQIAKLHGRIRLHEISTPIVFWKFFEKDDDKKIPFMRMYSVYNLEQTTGIPEKYIPKLPSMYYLDFHPIEAAEQLLAQYSDCPQIIYTGSQACYVPAYDIIKMPPPKYFINEEEFYGTLFHEQIHSSGSKNRLNRPGLKNVKFGTTEYAREELIAEIGASFLCAHCGIENRTIKNAAAYIQTWLERLRNDKKLIIQSAAHAERAANYILHPKANSEELAA
jgi:antirestriction protein ArdC